MSLSERDRARNKPYDYLLKFLLVGDSDVGKPEIVYTFQDGANESPFCSGSSKLFIDKSLILRGFYYERRLTSIFFYPGPAAYKTTTILLDGKRVKLQVWDTSGQGRFCTILRSYSRGAQGILLVYDITNQWSFDGLSRWLQEVEEVGGR